MLGAQKRRREGGVEWVESKKKGNDFVQLSKKFPKQLWMMSGSG